MCYISFILVCLLYSLWFLNLSMESWQKSLADSITGLRELFVHYPAGREPLQSVIDLYPMRITPYYFSLIRERGDPIWQQCIPDVRELEEDYLPADPLNEKGLSPVPGLIHRYPDRVVFLVSSACATFCRFCLRKNRFDRRSPVPDGSIAAAGLKYIEESPSIRDVVLSGGDPFLLQDEALEEVFSGLRRIPHVEIVRIHTRIPVTLPERITSALCRMMKRYHPLYVNTHFNHPAEITEASSEACHRLADAGVPLGNQTVLLRGVNDDLAVMRQLMQKLLRIRVRPYYIHQMDLVKGTGHFRTRVEKGLEIMAGLRGHTSGMAVPSYVVDLPGGKGKVPLLPDDVQAGRGKTFLAKLPGRSGGISGRRLKVEGSKHQAKITVSTRQTQ